jgi:hypothetical protein
MNLHDESLDFAAAGCRLSHILDKIGFREGRGRVTELHEHITSRCADPLTDLKYTTVRSWFNDHTPSMKKIEMIIDSLSEDYPIEHDLSQIKAWWKVGGYYPFVNIKQSDELPYFKQAHNDYMEKLQYIIMSLVTEEAGDFFETLSADDLRVIQRNTMQFADDFSNPHKIECAAKYLRMIIREEIKAAS